MSQPSLSIAETSTLRTRPEVSRQPAERHVVTAALAVLCTVALLLIGLPLASVLAKSLEGPAGEFFGLRNFVQYASSPNLRQSLANSLVASGITTAITVPLAFVFAMALVRSRMPCKGWFKGIALLPILAPSLLPAIALTYMFGNQGYLKPLMGEHSVYGLFGIVAAQVFYCFPHAVLILVTALALSDARLYEVARTLGASPWRAFMTITLPATRYGLLSATFVVITLSLTDFGIAKVIGGSYSVLAIDIYKQIIGQQNFRMGAVVGVVLLVPALLSFGVDAWVRRRQTSMLSSRTVLYHPQPRKGFDRAMLTACALISTAILVIIGTAVFASLVTLWPYDLRPSLASYDFAAFDGLGWGAYRNSVQIALVTAAGGTVLVFIGAYLVEKMQGHQLLRTALHAIAMIPMAVPGLVLGLGYVFFFNHPSNPLHALGGGIALMALCCIGHYYTVPHLTALTALKQLDREFEAASASLGVPFWTTLRRVTLPICLPAVLDIVTYFFVNAMTTVAAVIFLYAPMTKPAAVAAVSMDDTGDTAAACAMALMVLLTSAVVKLAQTWLGGRLARKSQAWRRPDA